MGGGLMQLVAYGAQDIYLTGNPQITFFKVVYRRHTNFSIETIEQTINGTSTLSTSTTKGSVTISRNGDLILLLYSYHICSSFFNSSNSIPCCQSFIVYPLNIFLFSISESNTFRGDFVPIEISILLMSFTNLISPCGSTDAMWSEPHIVLSNVICLSTHVAPFTTEA